MRPFDPEWMNWVLTAGSRTDSEAEEFAEAIAGGGEPMLYGIERKPGETEDELAGRVAARKAEIAR